LCLRIVLKVSSLQFLRRTPARFLYDEHLNCSLAPQVRYLFVYRVRIFLGSFCNFARTWKKRGERRRWERVGITYLLLHSTPAFILSKRWFLDIWLWRWTSLFLWNGRVVEIVFFLFQIVLILGLNCCLFGTALAHVLLLQLLLVVFSCWNCSCSCSLVEIAVTFATHSLGLVTPF